MKILAYAEFAAMPEGTVFEHDHGPAHHTPGLLLKGKTWEAEGDDGAGVSCHNLSYLIRDGGDPATAVSEFIEAWRGENFRFLVYEPADLDRLVELIRRREGGGDHA